MSYFVMVRGLVHSMSDVSVDPFWCDCRIGSYMIRYKCWIPFLEWRQLVSYQEYSAWYWDSIIWETGGTWSVTRNTQLGVEFPFSGRMEALVQLLGILSLGLRAILIWLWDVVLHDQMWAHGYSNVIEGCVPTWSDIRVDAILWKNGGTCSVTRNPQSRSESPSDAVLLSMVGCKCKALSMRCFRAWSNVSAEPFRCGAFEHGRL